MTDLSALHITARDHLRELKSTDDEESAQLRAALEQIPADLREYGPWWSTPAGKWLFQHIESRIGATLAARFSRQYGAAIEAADISNTAFVLLCRPTVLASIRKAENQWAYLYQTLRNEMLSQVGALSTLGYDLDAIAITEAEALQQRTGYDEAIDRTVEILSPLTPRKMRPHLAEAVAHVAQRGQHRISHAHTAAARDAELTGLGLSREQILALANIVLGARPHTGRTSILAGLLVDVDWNPVTSDAHRAALTKYQSRMTRASAPNTRSTEPGTATL